MSTILKRLYEADKVINSNKSNGVARIRAKKNIEDVVILLMKGYCLDDDATKLMKQYKHIDKVPDAKIHAGKEVTANKMSEFMEMIYPRVPHGHLVMIMIQKFGELQANYISNGEREDMIKALRSLAEKLEGGKAVEMPNSN